MSYTIHQSDQYRQWLHLNPIYPPSINVTGRCFKSTDLPYAKEINSSNPEIDFRRENCSRIVLRGDNREITTIQAAGGFHPNWSLDEVKQNPLSINEHRFNSYGSGYVSASTSLNVAHAYGSKFGFFTNKEYTIFAFDAIGAICPASPEQVGKYHLHNIDEYDVPGGVDAKAIVAFRRCKLVGYLKNQSPAGGVSHLTRCGDIFFNRNYQKDQRIVESLLLQGESAEISKPKETRAC